MISTLYFLTILNATILVFTGSSCSKSTDNSAKPVFDSIPQKQLLNAPLHEISGIAASKFPGSFWGIEDSGNPPQIHLISDQGILVKSVYVKGSVNRDWEALAISDNEIYIAETGDNALQFNEYAIYKFPEPSQTTDTVFNFEKIRFVYPDGPHDCEAMFVDAQRNIYLLTKNSNPSKVYKISYPYQQGLNTAVNAGVMKIGGLVAADISPTQDEVLVKTYTTLYYLKKSPGESLEDLLKKEPVKLPYVLEPQGEAVGFSNGNTGFYTVSEKEFLNQVNIYFYKRK